LQQDNKVRQQQEYLNKASIDQKEGTNKAIMELFKTFVKLKLRLRLTRLLVTKTRN